MDEGTTADVFLFEAFRLDRRAGALFRRDDKGAAVPVALGSRGLAALTILVARHGDLVSKGEIMQAVWPGTVVEDNNLTVQISALRRVLDQGRAGGSCIQTIPGRGYRFAAPVTRVDADARSATQTISHDGGRSRPRLSIVVLPFANLSDDREQQYFVDGITEDLTTDLSRFTSTVVTSRTTAATYRNKPVDARQIGRELGVRYILEGSVQRFPNHIRVNTRLIDARTDAHLWAQQFDRDPADPFAVQDEIGKQIEVKIYHELLAWEGSQPTEHPDALDYILRGRLAQMPFDGDNYTEAIGFFDRALTVDPRSVEAQGFLAEALARRVIDEMTGVAAADISRAAGLAAQAMAASPRSACAHSAQGQVLSAQNRYAEAIPAFETACALNPAWPRVYGFLSDCKFWTGSVGDAISLAEQTFRITPRDAWNANSYAKIGRVHLVQSRTNEAIAWLEKARRANPKLPGVHAMLASAYALNGEINRAAAELAEARGLSRDGRYSSFARLQRIGYFGVPEIQALFEATFFAGLRKIGMPEQ